MSVRGIDTLIEEYLAILENRRPLLNGRLYRDCSEAEKNNINVLLDVARMTRKTLVEGNDLRESDKEMLVFTMFESTLLNHYWRSKISTTEKKKALSEAEKLLRKIEPVLGKAYANRTIEGLRSLTNDEENYYRRFIGNHQNDYHDNGFNSQITR